MRAPVEEVLAALADAPQTFGAGQLVCLDGFSTSGKTTLAAALAEEMTRSGRACRVLHTDAMLPGWRGLPELGQVLATLLEPMSAGSPGTWREWDWHASGWARTHVEPPPAAGELVVLEGVGCSAGLPGRFATVKVWQEVAPEVQAPRWAERGDDPAHFNQWITDEQALHARWRTRESADLVLD